MQRLFKNLSLPSRIALIVCAAALVGCLAMMAVSTLVFGVLKLAG